jgi:ribonuclease P/MRP protein subunit POP5
MVRIKNRYLVVNFLYPDSSGYGTIKAPGAENDIVQFYQPSSPELTPAYLTPLLREAVGKLFGDYGSGAVGTTLHG